MTKEFFELARDRLAPGGVVVVNVGHPEGSHEFEEVIGATMEAVFPTVLRDPAEQTNTLMLGSLIVWRVNIRPDAIRWPSTRMS